MTRNNPITLKNLETLNQQNKQQILFISHVELSTFHITAFYVLLDMQPRKYKIRLINRLAPLVH